MRTVRLNPSRPLGDPRTLWPPNPPLNPAEERILMTPGGSQRLQAFCVGWHRAHHYLIAGLRGAGLVQRLCIAARIVARKV